MKFNLFWEFVSVGKASDANILLVQYSNVSMQIFEISNRIEQLLQYSIRF